MLLLRTEGECGDHYDEDYPDGPTWGRDGSRPQENWILCAHEGALRATDLTRRF